MIRPFAPFAPRPRVVSAIKVAHGLAPSDAELTHDPVNGRTYRSTMRLASNKGTSTLKVLGRKPKGVVVGTRG